MTNTRYPIPKEIKENYEHKNTNIVIIQKQKERKTKEQQVGQE